MISIGIPVLAKSLPIEFLSIDQRLNLAFGSLTAGKTSHSSCYSSKWISLSTEPLEGEPALPGLEDMNSSISSSSPSLTSL